MWGDVPIHGGRASDVRIAGSQKNNTRLRESHCQMKRVLVGFAAALMVLSTFVYFVGAHDVAGALARANLPVFALAILSSFLALVCWGMVWNRVLSVVDHSVSRIKIGMIFLSGMFANFITPFGQVGGEPFIALVLTKYSDIDYERALAAIIAADVINLIPFFSYGLLGFTYFVLTNSLNETLETFVAAFVLAFVLSGVLLWTVWNRRGGVERVVVAVTGGLRATVGRFSETAHELLEPDAVRLRVEEFFNMLDFIWDHRRKMVYAVVLSHVGWFFTIVPLYIAAVALGLDVPFMYVLFIVPLGSIAGYLPLPGGLGSVEVMLAAVIVSVTSLGLPAATATAILYRIAVYWFTLLIGGLSLSYLSAGLYELERET